MNQASKPLIGLSGRRKSAAEVAGFPDSLAGLAVDLYLADYARRVLEAGGLPVHLPMDTDPVDYLPRLDGILLSGGADMAPVTYGAEPDGHGTYEPERDQLELAMLTGARARGLPVLGICRGLQVINVDAGGTLHQHVPVHARYEIGPDSRVHAVTFEPGSLLGRLYGQGAEVNSLHHQTVEEVGSGLRVTARADDGTVEGLESEDGMMVAVQWHPEMLPATEPVFGWLVEQARSLVT